MAISTLLIIIAIGYIGSIIAKLLFYFSNIKTSEKISGLYLAIPFSSFRVESFIKVKSFSTKVSRSVVVSIELLGMLSFLIFTISILLLIANSFPTNIESLMLFVFNLYFVVAILYFSINDILRLKLPARHVRMFLLSVIAINLCVGAFRFVTYLTTGNYVLESVNLGYIDNLVAGLLLALVAFVCMKVDKKSFGMVDIDLLLAVGLILGMPTSVFALLFITIIAAVIAIVYSLKIKKIKGVIIPFAPAVLLGYVIAIGFGQQILDFFNKL